MADAQAGADGPLDRRLHHGPAPGVAGAPQEVAVRLDPLIPVGLLQRRSALLVHQPRGLDHGVGRAQGLRAGPDGLQELLLIAAVHGVLEQVRVPLLAVLQTIHLRALPQLRDAVLADEHQGVPRAQLRVVRRLHRLLKPRDLLGAVLHCDERRGDVVLVPRDHLAPPDVLVPDSELLELFLGRLDLRVPRAQGDGDVHHRGPQGILRQPGVVRGVDRGQIRHMGQRAYRNRLLRNGGHLRLPGQPSWRGSHSGALFRLRLCEGGDGLGGLSQAGRERRRLVGLEGAGRGRRRHHHGGLEVGRPRLRARGPRRLARLRGPQRTTPAASAPGAVSGVRTGWPPRRLGRRDRAGGARLSSGLQRGNLLLEGAEPPQASVKVHLQSLDSRH
mmetsp:Transcript_23373/g.51883  ORF Transcript_23373/g.51883 Transcript_23373/m.51883 type:complete len:388 (+) Transcript_23373:409-1572(+)